MIDDRTVLVSRKIELKAQALRLCRPEKRAEVLEQIRRLIIDYLRKEERP